MGIFDQLKVINENLEMFQSKYKRLNDYKNEIEQKCAATKDSIDKKYQPEISKIETVKKGLLAFHKVIKNYTSKEIVTNYRKKQTLDKARLYSMLSKVESQRFSNRDAACEAADKLTDLINSNLAYMDARLAEVKERQNKEFADVNDAMTKELALFSDKKEKLFSSVELYVEGDDVKALNISLDRIYSAYKITDDYFSHWGDPGFSQSGQSEMLLGFKRIPVSVPEFACTRMKDCLGENFDVNTKTVSCPVVFSTGSFEEITVEYTDKNESVVKNGIQALILNFLRCFNVNFRVSLLDSIHYNAELLGPLADLAKGKNSLADKVPQDENGLGKAVSILAAYYRNVESKIGRQTVYQYNSSCKGNEFVPFRILIINKKDEMFRSFAGDDISYIINNAAKFGITVIKLLKKSDDPEKERPMVHSGYADDTNREKITSDADGNFYIESGKDWIRFEWFSYSGTIPSGFIEKIQKLLQPSDNGTKYFKRYKMHLPEKSTDKRRPIVLPFALDDDDNVISCNFDNDNFAAYIMGASGSGKSTLLHTLIAGILMNYHPDEVELWLIDFKMTEFKRYVDNCPPHVKYILLENSEDLVFDIIDELTQLLRTRKQLFAAQRPAWNKLNDVPLDRNVPAVFVIIDEFAQMSQIICRTKGGDGDYTVKLNNLLAQGRAFGFNFIFASQTYTTGVSGLTESARDQIQMRFAMKNTVNEIKQTLNLTSCDEEIANNIRLLSDTRYETMFKWRDKSDTIKIGKYRNMYVTDTEIEDLIKEINDAMKPLPFGSTTDNSSYIDKKPMLIDGERRPRTFESLIEYYRDSEAKRKVKVGKVLIYPGVPCTFKLDRSFELSRRSAENILLLGGNTEEKISVLKSILKSYERTCNNIELWADENTLAFENYENSFDNVRKISDLAKICSRISTIRSDIQAGKVTPGLIVCMGYELMASDFEIHGGRGLIPAQKSKSEPVDENKSPIPSLSEILKKAKNCDPDGKRRMIAEYNASVQEYKAAGKKSHEEEASQEEEKLAIRDARNDLKWILEKGPLGGLHFLFYFEDADDFTNLPLFKHKLLFAISTNASSSITGNKKASEIEEGVFLYTNGKDVYTMRPHIFKGIPLNGWIVDDNGDVVQKL